MFVMIIWFLFFFRFFVFDNYEVRNDMVCSFIQFRVDFVYVVLFDVFIKGEEVEGFCINVWICVQDVQYNMRCWLIVIGFDDYIIVYNEQKFVFVIVFYLCQGIDSFFEGGLFFCVIRDLIDDEFIVVFRGVSGIEVDRCNEFEVDDIDYYDRQGQENVCGELVFWRVVCIDYVNSEEVLKICFLLIKDF